jgi:L-ascorbate metabolism protein UlaG (beta-lactamase superfamily)
LVGITKEFTLSTSTTASSSSSAPADLNSGSVLFIGNATVLIRFAGFTILTDPTFIHMHEKVDLGYGLRTTRLTNPSMSVSELPPIDFVLLSHFHGDHFDQVAIRELDKSLPIITTPHAAEELKAHGFKRIEKLEKWESVIYKKGDIHLTITATPGRHGPLPVSIFLPQVMGSILDFQTKNGDHLFRVYITGDTMVFDDIKEIPKRHPNIDLALLHLGGTTVMGLVVTMDSKEGLKMLKIIDPHKAIPIHYNDYDVFKSPLSDFQNEVKQAGLENRVHYLSHGEIYTFELNTYKN